ncbi:MAG: pcp 3 [Planctomycetota bacterium]|nr:pcp 3 [Planctomycetota bacterium]
MSRPSRRALRPHLDRLDNRCLLSGLTPQLVKHAYNLDSIKFTANGQTIQGNGSGQTIAVVVAYHDPNLASDLMTFDRAYGLSDPTLTQVNQAGAATNDGWAGEEALDVEWAHAIAPGANIVVVEARTDSFNDMMTAVNTAKNLPGVSVVSMSWGMSEFRAETSYDSIFTTPAGHTGITFVAASGDSGSAAGAEWPSSSPNVLSVGGTSLFVGAGSTYAGESAWSGSGGGVSLYEAEPAYQRGVQTSGRRTSPDVAFDANPSTGVSVYVTSPSTGRGSWQVYGGTSLGAPAWAGIMAIVNQGRATAGLGTLNGATQTLPALYALPSSDFHKTGSLTTTGLGTPNGASLVNDLAFGVGGSGVTVASTTSSTASTTTTTGNQAVTTVHRKRHKRKLAHVASAAVDATSAHNRSNPAQALLAIDRALADLTRVS